MSIVRRIRPVLLACAVLPLVGLDSARGQEPPQLTVGGVVRGAECGGLAASITVLPGRHSVRANENGVFSATVPAQDTITVLVNHSEYDPAQWVLTPPHSPPARDFNLRRTADGASCEKVVGRVDGIKELVQGGRREREHDNPTASVQRRPDKPSSRIDLAPNSSLFLDDSIHVARRFHARVSIDRQAGVSQSGTLVFFAEPKDASLDTVIQRVRTGAPGRFALTREGDQVAISIRSGALGVAEWNPGGSLTVHAGNQRAVIKGTSALFLSSEDGQEAIMFLDDGEITLPEHPAFSVPEDAIVRLSQEGPELLTAASTATLVGALTAELTFAVKDLWSTSLFEKPWLYLGAALIGLTAWCIVECPPGSDPVPVDVTFIIPNPSRF